MNWIKVKKLNSEAELPEYQSLGASGMDLHSIIDYTLTPGHFHVFPTGISVQLPIRHEGQIRSRSGMAARHGVVVLNSPGSIDNDYTGELKVILINHSNVSYQVKKGDRIAQLIIAPYKQFVVQEVDDLMWTARGASGLGSTGR